MPAHIATHGPPPAPEIRRALTFTAGQKIGVPLLFAIPILALCGVFGPSSATRHVSRGTLDVQVTYPDRLHFHQQTPLRIMVHNTGRLAIDTVSVTVDTAYLRAFSAIKFVPAERQAYMISATHIAPGETRLVATDITGEFLGHYQGVVSIVSRADTLLIPVSTIIFP